MHKTIKKVEHDIENFAFNTAISALRILVNELLAAKSQQSVIPLSADDYLKFLQILSPFAPHLSEELAERLELGRSIFSTTWPAYDESLIAAGQINLVVQVNGKLRGTLTVAREISEAEALALAQAQPGISRQLTKNWKVIYVPGRLQFGKDTYYATLLSELENLSTIRNCRREKGQTLINERIYQRIVAEAGCKDIQCWRWGQVWDFNFALAAGQASLAVELDDRPEYLQSGVAAANLNFLDI